MNRHFGLVSALGLSRRLGPAACLTLALWGSSSLAGEDAQPVRDTGDNELQHPSAGPPEARPDATPGPTPPAPEPGSEPPALPQEPARAEETARAAEPADGSSIFVQGQDSLSFMVRPPKPKRARTKAQARLTGLAVMTARIATEANLKAAGTFEAPRGMTDRSERQVFLRRPEPAVQPVKPASAPPPASAGVLDEGIVKEIVQRKTMFRMCYESARRRGVNVTRADVKWRLSPDGSVRDVVVEVAQDDLLARCIRVIASRPFPTTVPQEVPVAIPLLFVSER